MISTIKEINIVTNNDIDINIFRIGDRPYTITKNTVNEVKRDIESVIVSYMVLAEILPHTVDETTHLFNGFNNTFQPIETALKCIRAIGLYHIVINSSDAAKIFHLKTKHNFQLLIPHLKEKNDVILQEFIEKNPEYAEAFTD